MDDKLIAAIIAAITSIITLFLSFIFRPIIDKKSHLSKVEVEHEYEQRKKIKEVLSNYKIHLLNSSESLRGRLSNLAKYYDKNWHKVDGDYLDGENYYFQSTIYRILSFYAWVKVINSKLIYLDTTIATESDLYFLKYLKAMRRTLQRGKLAVGLQEESEREQDMIFRDSLDEMCQWLIKGDDVKTFSEFKEGIADNISKYRVLCEFIDGISASEDRRRWDRLYSLQLLIICFLNSYGYDFQFSNTSLIERRIEKSKKTDMFPNLIKHFEKYKLENEKSAKVFINIMNKYVS